MARARSAAVRGAISPALLDPSVTSTITRLLASERRRRGRAGASPGPVAGPSGGMSPRTSSRRRRRAAGSGVGGNEHGGGRARAGAQAPRPPHRGRAGEKGGPPLPLAEEGGGHDQRAQKRGQEPPRVLEAEAPHQAASSAGLGRSRSSSLTTSGRIAARWRAPSAGKPRPRANLSSSAARARARSA